MEPRYLLDNNFKLIDNKKRKNSDVNVSNARESGNALEYFIFEDYTILEKLILSTKNLSCLNNITLLTKDNFDELREFAKQLTKDVKLIILYDKTNEINKKYKEKIIDSKNINKKKSEIRLLSDLGIEEIY